MKIVTNNCYGGFGLSAKATKRLAEMEGKECYFFIRNYPDRTYVQVTEEEAQASLGYWHAFDVIDPNRKDLDTNEHGIYYSQIERDDPRLIQVVEELGDEANGDCAKLRIVEIPDGTQWEIDEYNGNEHVEEVHQKWY